MWGLTVNHVLSLKAVEDTSSYSLVCSPFITVGSDVVSRKSFFSKSIFLGKTG